MPKGRIINENGGNYIVLADGERIVCRARGKFRALKVLKDSSFNSNMNKMSKKMSTNTIKLSPKVGDEVEVSIFDGVNFITEIYPRKNELIRPDIANVDQIILVFASAEPTFSYYLLDMFLVNLAKSKVEPLIIISKIDLLSDSELGDLKRGMAYYQSIGYKVLFVNSKKLDNKDEIIDLLRGRVSVLSGQTGAGKSSLINALIPGFKLNTQEISQALGRGKHTTREITLYEYFDGLIGDTPGFSKLELSEIDKRDLTLYFREFKECKCKFRDCIHLKNTPGCGVYESYVNKNLKATRYDNYLKMLDKINEK